MTKQGVERAAEWGWPNIYTYTKSMGDQLVARETGIVRSIVRPAIVESAVAFPFRGWNEGFTTSAPLVYLALKGQNMLPVAPKLILDVVPVDHVVAGMLMVAAQAIVEQPKLVFQLSSGDLNPLHMERVDDADRPLQAPALPGQGDRQQVPERAGGADGVPPRHAGASTTASRCRRFRSRARRPRRWTRSGRAGARGASPRWSIGSRRGSTRSSASPPRRRRTSSCSAPSSSRTPTFSAPTTSAPCATACRPRTRPCWSGRPRRSTCTTTG